MHCLDDLCRIDALQVGRGGAQVSVPELALDQIHGDALPRQLDRVCMPELVRREPAADSGLERQSAQLATYGRA